MPTAARTAPETAPKKAPTGPLWARAVHAFYDPIFDIRSRAAFQEALNDFVSLPADERAFHQTHLLYRQVHALEDIFGVLVRVEQRLNDLSVSAEALEHLEPMREALAELASDRYALARDGRLDGEDYEEGDEEEEEEDEDEARDTDPTGQDDDLNGDPDFIYEPIPKEAPARPPRPRLVHSQPEPEAAAPAADPEREALVGDLVPSREGQQDGSEGDR